MGERAIIMGMSVTTYMEAKEVTLLVTQLPMSLEDIWEGARINEKQNVLHFVEVNFCVLHVECCCTEEATPHVCD